MASSTSPDAFTLVDSPSPPALSKKYASMLSGTAFSMDSQITTFLRSTYPDLVLTKVPANNCNLLYFAYSGNASAELDISTEAIERWRIYYQGFRGSMGGLGDAITFAKYHYKWAGQDFILYTVQQGYMIAQYILSDASPGETNLTHSTITDALLTTIGKWQTPNYDEFIYIYDRYWGASTELWKQVQHASWDDVILDDGLKTALTEVVGKFFDSKDIYDDLGVPWKRGLMMYGPAGNGKTISIKAIMHTLQTRKPPVATLYVKAAPTTYDISNVWAFARYMAPCLLVLEDVDTIITNQTRSYAFNEIDGLENNDGILMLATTNHLDRLDPGLVKRPSRFDRKYLFPLPSKEERTLYCTYWRKKLASKPAITFPKKLCPAIAGITADFSFAYLKEAFVATLLVIAGNQSDPNCQIKDDSDGDDDLDDYELWREMKKQVKILRDDMDSTQEQKAFDERTEHMGHSAELERQRIFGGGMRSMSDGSKVEVVHPRGAHEDDSVGNHGALAIRTTGGEYVSPPPSGAGCKAPGAVENGFQTGL